VVRALTKLKARNAIVDGEVVGFRGRRTSFEILQQRGTKPTKIVLFLFDVLHVDGDDTTALPLTERKALLRSIVPSADPVLRVTVARKGDATTLLNKACADGWEGLIAKRAEAPYTHARSRDWLKLKCSAEQEFVVGGYSDPKGSRVGFGALLLGVYDGKKLRYAGEVGTGFDTKTLRELRAKLDAIERSESPFDDFTRPRKGVHWTQPRLVAQVAFTEWTRDGRLRHPRFLGLRSDKRPSDVVRERPS
jgi:bifunctional non-homologous end joining protein LigD